MTRPLCIKAEPEIISGYRFHPSHLRIGERIPGISAFMRIRNGADFLELTIRSHLPYFDEIVAVYNQCTDATAEVLLRLQTEVGAERLRVIHYTDRVFPPGSEDHARTAPTSPHSLVNYYNCALASTRYRFATKLDDDHLAISEPMAAITQAIREDRVPSGTMHCFSGLNIFPRRDGTFGILQQDPISGGGDIGFFRVSEQTLFTHDRRFERFQRGGLKRRFAGFLYWHLKYLKDQMGFANYELGQYANSRYASRQRRIHADPHPTMDLPTLAATAGPRFWQRIQKFVSEKQALMLVRDAAIPSTFPDRTVDAAIRRTVAPEFRTSLQAKAA